jgi:hypothetical protein
MAFHSEQGSLSNPFTGLARAVDTYAKQRFTLKGNAEQVIESVWVHSPPLAAYQQHILLLRYPAPWGGVVHCHFFVNEILSEINCRT